MSDADAIARVHVLTWQVAYKGLIPDDYLDALSVDRRAEVWRKILGESGEGERTWVAEADRSIVGFAGVGPSRDDDAVEGGGELYGIYVMAEYWDAGVGARLMVTSEEWLAGRFSRATLWVLEGNERARTFYEKFGWVWDGVRKRDDRGSFVLEEVRYARAFDSDAA